MKNTGNNFYLFYNNFARLFLVFWDKIYCLYKKNYSVNTQIPFSKIDRYKIYKDVQKASEGHLI